MLLWKAVPTWLAAFCTPVTTWPAKFWILPSTPIGDVTLLVLGAGDVALLGPSAAGGLLPGTPAAGGPAGYAGLAATPLPGGEGPACPGTLGVTPAGKA